MFLESLSFKQRKIFLELVKKVIISEISDDEITDEITDEKEKAYVRSICIGMSLEGKDDFPISVDAMADIFKTNEERKILFQLGISHVYHFLKHIKEENYYE